MGIRNFDCKSRRLLDVPPTSSRPRADFLAERSLVKDAPLSALAGTRIGIDADHYLARLLSSRDPATSDNLIPAVGGSPLALTSQVSPRAPLCRAGCLEVVGAGAQRRGEHGGGSIETHQLTSRYHG
jgi:hypothetical protein